MPAPSLFPLLWAQQVVQQKVPPSILQWLLVWGAPDLTDRRWYGGPITWIKVVGLLCLLAWVFSWVVSASRLRGLWPFRRVGLSTLFAGLGLGLVSVIVQVLDQTGRIKFGA